MNAKEIAKFFAGFAANQLLTHGALAVAGIRFSVFGINYTPQLNTIAAIAWGTIALLLIYYAWVRR
ncbi:putative membrane protein [Sphingomonas sp. S17]|uniref:Uncharacterized protein n=1 Tax=Sphingomonas yabuuchiae TaxID=172044 RepID=A0AA41DEE2_9SPHN|nr:MULTISPECIES: hypothetical protein [Sphingomonas]EGI53990.1 putative membrane protein [Sphingomonas sp. S17]MBB4611255.1 hypothetical protein [Sphingomonas yabuuchiae]MBN3557035.1 hypothetical protein [Sphingomonas yabuuchiae]